LNLLEYRFVRLLPDGSEDTSYQDRLREIQEKEQDIQGERSRIETVRAKKQKEISEAESKFNARVAEARGFKEQSAYQGDAYYEARSNEAKAILAEGTAEVEGLQKQIAALSGKGGQAMVRLEIAKQIAKANPKFVAINPSQAANGGAHLDLSKTDMNQLLQQLGIVEGIVGQPQREQGESAQQQPSGTTPPSAGEAGNQP
jgi:chromosome segregation ATPase